MLVKVGPGVSESHGKISTVSKAKSFLWNLRFLCTEMITSFKCDGPWNINACYILQHFFNVTLVIWDVWTTKNNQYPHLRLPNLTYNIHDQPMSYNQIFRVLVPFKLKFLCFCLFVCFFNFLLQLTFDSLMWFFHYICISKHSVVVKLELNATQYVQKRMAQIVCTEPR